MTLVRRLRDQNVGDSVPWVSSHFWPESQCRSQGTSHHLSGLAPILDGSQSKVSVGMQRSEVVKSTC
ncbi:hypothetical protein, partial [Actinomadura bangladeshensis]|uniref:hypothetical protein n=1 Tax=Actinomadura bangladeshensis TaxID=453573 RepID=UPI001A9EAF70